MKHPVLWLIINSVALSWSPAEAAAAEEKVNFSRDIRPLLSDSCFACHGPAAKSVKGDLRLDLRDAATAKNKDGRTAIAPGDPDASELVRRIHLDDPEKGMPPADSHKKLSADQKRLLAEWIKQGAVWGEHWSFVPPVTPPLPTVKATTWPINAIDRFVLARIEAAGLSSSAQADRPTLIRRVSYDLTGLPPTPAEVDAFVNDTADGAYEAMVDRYLARPAFGERMALAWMDAARYGDSSALHADGPRDMWGWRDWVIRSYNENMPFDRFTIEQIAGDLLPGDDAWPKVASAFNRNHVTSDEGGAIPEELRVSYVVDRVKTTSNVWLGLSMECAQCHDHKYDPISQREYYAFFAFFNQTTDPGMQTRKGNQAPVVTLPNGGNDQRIAALNERRTEVDRLIAGRGEAVTQAFEKWAVDQTALAATGRETALPGDMLVYLPLDETGGEIVTDQTDKQRTGKVQGKPAWATGQLGGGFATDASAYIAFDAKVADFNRSDSFSYGCWVKPDGPPDGTPLSKMDNANGYRGWDLILGKGEVSVHIIQNWPTDALKVTTKQRIKTGEWTHLFATYDGSGKASGVKIYINGVSQELVVNNDNLSGETLSQAPLQVGRRHPASPFDGIVDEVRIYSRTLSSAEVGALAGVDPLRPILATPAAQRTPEQVQRLREHYLTSVDTEYGRLKRELGEIAQEIAGLTGAAVSVMVMGEQPKPRDTFMLMRGQYASPDTKAGAIRPDIPAAFGKVPDGAPPNRLGLAQWLVRRDHPMTARVAINRYWAIFFGRGIVGTVMDFGSQGAFPTHPELLDWLAVDFMEHGWDRKRAIKQILMSATYRQSSVTTPKLSDVDPENRLLARGPRFRLQGEFIRDTALAVSGLLADKVGGPSVKPYQPPGLWEEVGFGDRFVQDKGDNLYRKSMYTYWKRSAPHPGMLLFDAPTREACTVDRPRTNTPLQALYTMNDTQFVEAARMFAERIMAEGGPTTELRVAFAHRLTTSRPPSPRVIAALADLYHSELSRFKADPERAKRLLSHGERPRNAKLDPAEHAAWTMVATTVLNMDAALTRY